MCLCYSKPDCISAATAMFDNLLCTSMSRWKALFRAGRGPRFFVTRSAADGDCRPRCWRRLCPELPGVPGASRDGAAIKELLRQGRKSSVWIAAQASSRPGLLFTSLGCWLGCRLRCGWRRSTRRSIVIHCRAHLNESTTRRSRAGPPPGTAGPEDVPTMAVVPCPLPLLLCLSGRCPNACSAAYQRLKAMNVSGHKIQ